MSLWASATPETSASATARGSAVREARLIPDTPPVSALLGPQRTTPPVVPGARLVVRSSHTAPPEADWQSGSDPGYLRAMLPEITAEQARRLVLSRQGLADGTHGRLTTAGVAELVERLGFLQVDSI